jgi:hypothetical protein
VGLACADAGAQGASFSGKRPAAGILCLAGPDGGGRSAFDNAVVDGVILRTSWALTEPQNGVYDWNSIDRLVQEARRTGKIFGLGVVAGFRSPEWFLRSGALTLTTDFSRNYAQQRQITVPVPWDPAFQRKWGEFLQAAAARYDAEPAVAYVLIAGLGQAFEPFMARTPEDRRAFEAMGGLPRWIEGAKLVIDLYALHFKSTPFVLTMHNPVLSAEGEQAIRAVVEYGLRAYPGRFGIKYDGLDAVASPDVASPANFYHRAIFEWSARTPVGYQMVWATQGINAKWLRGTLEEVLERGVAVKAHFVEVYAVDCNNPQFSNVLKRASAGLRANAAIFSRR